MDSRRILVVDDEQGIRKLLATLRPRQLRGPRSSGRAASDGHLRIRTFRRSSVGRSDAGKEWARIGSVDGHAPPEYADGVNVRVR